MSNHPILSSMIFAIVGLGLLAGVMVLPTRGDKVTLIFPIGTSAFQAFAHVVNAGGAIIKQGGSANMIVASFPNKPVQEIIETTGALFVLDAGSISSCFKGDYKNGFGKNNS